MANIEYANALTARTTASKIKIHVEVINHFDKKHTRLSLGGSPRRSRQPFSVFLQSLPFDLEVADQGRNCLGGTMAFAVVKIYSAQVFTHWLSCIIIVPACLYMFTSRPV